MIPKARTRSAWWRRFLAWLMFWRTPEWYARRRLREAEDRVNPKDTYLLVYETPNGPALLGRYRGRADDAMDAAETAYVNLIWNKGQEHGAGDYHELGGVVHGQFGIVPEDSLSEEAKARIKAATEGDHGQ
jgi:hypothetical protein